MGIAFRHSAGFGKRMEYNLVGKMLMEGLDVYLPLVDDHGVDCVIKKEDGAFIEMALIRLVSVLGMYAADENDQLPFPNTFLGKQAGIFKISFDLLFQRIVNGQKIYDSMMPIKAIENYYKDLGVIIFETEEGFYYSIPD